MGGIIPSGRSLGELINSQISAQLLFIAFVFLLSVGIVIKLIPIIIKISLYKGLATPISTRSSHVKPVPSLGGIAIFASLIVALSLSGILFSNKLSFWLLLSLLFIFGVGLKDDLLASSAKLKFVGQLIAALLFIFNPEFYIPNPSGFLGLNTVQWISMTPLTLFFVLSAINAFNLIDGIDGLAASLAILSATVLSVFFWLSNEFFYLGLSLSLIGSLCAFLFFNFSKGKLKIFLGDSGALLSGTLLSVLSLKFLTLGTTPETSTIPLFSDLNNKAVFLLYLFSIPLFDVSRVFFYRILHHKNPFKPDRNHLHHILVDKLKNHKKATAILVSANAAVIVLFFILNNFLSNILLLIFYLTLFTIAILTIKRNTNIHQSGS